MRAAHVFLCEGFVSADQTLPVRFRFCVYEDGSLAARLAPDPNATPAYSNNPVCFIYDGRAQRRPASQTPHDDGAVFDCSFKLVRFWRHQLQNQFLVCHTQLSETKGLQGHYVVVHGDDDRPHAREVALPIALSLLPVEYHHGPISEPMTPLTPGTYQLKGFTVTSSGTVYECIVMLELHGDGSLHGKSYDLLFPQHCELHGKWTHDEVVYTLTYKFSATSSSNYLYKVTPSDGGLRGRWAHEDTMRSQRPAERGHAELFLEKALRVWSPAFHKLYPRAFQDVTKLLLLKSHRSPTRTAYALPGTLWQHVLAFCDLHHFSEAKAMQAGGSV